MISNPFKEKGQGMQDFLDAFFMGLYVLYFNVANYAFLSLLQR